MSCVEVVPSSSFVDVLRELASLTDAPRTVKSVLVNDGKIALTTSDIKWCHQKIKQRSLPHRIHQLLNESDIILPKYEPPLRSPELEARIQKLKAQQANREYRKMTKNLIVNQYEAASLKGLGTDVKEIGVQLREVNRQLITGVQYLLSIIGTFFGVFIGISYVLNGFGERLLLATFCAVIVAIAEIYFIIRQDMIEETDIQKKSL